MNIFGKSIHKEYYTLFKSHYEPPHLILIKNKAIKFYDKELGESYDKEFEQSKYSNNALVKTYNHMMNFFNKKTKKEKINLLDKTFNNKPNTKLLALRKPSYPDCDVEFIYFGNNFAYKVVNEVPVNLTNETPEMSEITINLTKEKQSDVHYKFNVNENGELVEFKENN